MLLSSRSLSRARFRNPWTFGSVDKNKTLTLLNQSLRKITEEIEIPHIDPASKKLDTKRFFEKIDQASVVPFSHTKIFLYGGVVRSMLGYLCHHLHSEYERKQECISTHQVLEEFLDAPPRLTALEVLGIGSDLDIVYEGCAQRAEDLQPLQMLIKELIDAYRDTLSDGFAKQYFALSGDVLEYGPQLRQSMHQGGSPLDWLAFPLTARSGARIQVPDAHPEIINQLLQGHIHFSPIQNPHNYKTIARQVRPLLEMPYLEPTPDSLPHLIQSIEQLSSSYCQEKTARSVDQIFAKAVRNARFWGACNAYACLDPVSSSPLQKAVHVLSRQKPETPLIPEFLPNIDIANRTDDFDPGNLSAQGFLMSREDFIEKWTDCGRLYHGTPSLVNVACMIRVGLQISTDQRDRPQGCAMDGRGFYMTNLLNVSTGYAGTGGVVLGLEIFPSGKLRILDVQNFPTQLLENLKKEAEAVQKDFHEYLCDQYAIDIIIKTHILIQNARAIVVPKTIEEWTESLSHHWQKRLEDAYDLAMLSKDPIKVFKLLKEFGSFDQLHRLSGNTSNIVLQAATWVASRLRSEPPSNHQQSKQFWIELAKSWTAFVNEGQIYPEAVQIASTLIQADCCFLRYYASKLFQALFNKGHGYLEAIQAASTLLNNDLEYRDDALKLFQTLFDKGQGYSEAIQAASTAIQSKPNSSVRLFQILFDQGYGYLEAIQAASTGMQSNESFGASRLFRILFDKGHGYSVAIQVASTLLSPHNSWSQYNKALKLFQDLFDKGEGYSEAIQAASTLIQLNNNSQHHRCALKLFQALFEKGQGYPEAVQIASTLIQADCCFLRYYASKLFQALFNKGHGYLEAIQAASTLLNNNLEYRDDALKDLEYRDDVLKDLGYCDDALKLFQTLFDKGHGYSVAIQVASTLLSPHNSWSQYNKALKLFQALFEKGQGYPEAIQVASTLLQTNDDFTHDYALELFRILFDKGRGYSEAIQVAAKLIQSKDELWQRPNARKLLQALCDKGQGDPEAVSEAFALLQANTEAPFKQEKADAQAIQGISANTGEKQELEDKSTLPEPQIASDFNTSGLLTWLHNQYVRVMRKSRGVE